jgi:hypothetical protein
MKSRLTLVLGIAGALLMAATALFTPGCTCGPEVRNASPTRIEPVTYRGWTNAWRLANQEAEVIVVPAIGRVMSFRFLHGENVFWEDRSLAGQRGNWNGKEWINFGGDKTWPAPEADWGRHTGRKEWMPPPAFDSLPVEARVEGRQVVLTSPVDPYYGVRTVRRLSLFGSNLQILTRYEKVSGDPFKIGIWVISQFKDPVAVYMPVPANSIFTNGHFIFGPEPWPQLQRRGAVLEMTRDRKTAHKMGGDARQLLWVGAHEMCLVSASSSSVGEYPDRGASAEVYTNPDPKEYVELELLGPLAQLQPGQTITLTSLYQLQRRTQKDAAAELSRFGFK